MSYSRRDAGFLRQLLPHLELLVKRGILSVSYDADLNPGQRYDPELRRLVEECQIFLALVSIDYLNSEYCFEKELGWALAKERSEGCAIVPLLLRRCDWHSTVLTRYSVLPRAAAYVSESADVESELYEACVELERLARYLMKKAGEPVGRRHYFPRTSRLHGVPPLPSRFVERVDVAERLRRTAAALVEQNRADADRRPSALALCGLGGSGKTSLAIAHARNPEVLGDFKDGVFWVTCGRNGEVAELQTALLELAGYQGEVSDRWQENKKLIVDVFEDLDALIILDDVWTADQAIALCGDVHRSLTLITSRFTEVAAEAGATVVELRQPPEHVALEMFGRYADRRADAIPRSGLDILQRCGYLPLAVAVMGSLIRSGAFGWESLLRALDSSAERPALMQYTTALSSYQWRSIEAAFQTSFDSLDEQSATAFLACRVFDRSTTFPRQVLVDLTAQLHAGDFSAYLTIEDALVSRSLLNRQTNGGVFLTIHDLLVDYAEAEAAGRGENAHGTLIRNLRARLGRADPIPALRDEAFQPYYRDELFRHLARSPDAPLAAEIILDLDWMTRRIRAYGPSKLLADCADSTSTDIDTAGLAAVREIHDALLMSAHTLSQAPDELLVQLEGRLTPAAFAAISSARPFPAAGAAAAGAAAAGTAVRLRALRRNFERGGGALERTVVLDGSPVLDLAVDRDLGLAAAVSLDGTLAVVAIEAGDVRLSHCLGPVTSRLRFCRLANRRLLLHVPGGSLECVDLEHGSVASVVTLSGAAVGPLDGLTASATSRGRLVAWNDTGLYRLEVAGEGPTVRLETLADGFHVEDCTMDPESGLFAVAEEGGLLSWGQVDAWTLIVSRINCDGEIRFVRLVDNGAGALLFFYSGEVARLDLRRRVVAWRRRVHTDWIECVDVHEAAGLLATGAHDKRMVVSRISDGSMVLERAETAGYVRSVRLWGSSTAGSAVAWSSLDESLCAKELRSGGRSATILGHSGRINAIEPGGEHGLLISCSDDGTLRVWSAERAYAATVSAAEHQQRISCVYVDGGRTWTASYDGSVAVWDSATGTPIAKRVLETRPIHVVDGIGEGVCLAGSEAGGVYRLRLDEAGGALSHDQVGDYGTWVPAIMFLPGRQRSVIGTGNGDVGVFNAVTRHIEYAARLHDGPVRCFAPASRASFFYSGSEDRRIALSELGSPESLVSRQAHDDWVNRILIHPDADAVFTISDDGTMRGFDPLSLEPVRPVMRHGGWLSDAVALRGPARIAAGGADGRIYLWDAATGRLLRDWRAHAGWISCLAVVPDGTLLVSASADQSVRLWDTADFGLSASVCLDTGVNVNCLAVVAPDILVIGGENGKTFFIRIER